MQVAYFTDLLSPETYEAFTRSPRDISGFRRRQMNMAEKINPGDVFICYLTKLSRWIGLLEVVEGPFIDEQPRFLSENDPFVVRFRVRPTVWLDIEKGIPIHDQSVWEGLSFTRGLKQGSTAWTGKVRGSLVNLGDQDGAFLAERLTAQAIEGKPYPLDEQDKRNLATHIVNRPDKVVAVSVPDDASAVDLTEHVPETETRESIRMQAQLANIGAKMGMKIWIPRADRGGVLREWANEEGALLDRLPLNYDETTLRTIEQIDVLWLKGRSIVRAFEVEHTTSVYSGILRMADLVALQPNMNIKLHIVAPETRRDKVFQEIRRPVFSLLEKGPLAEYCTYLSYASLHKLAEQEHLSYMSDTVLDKYEEEAE
ncbi:MAG: hypothetical protein JWR14_3543 [Caballeronia sp.]|jgi:hypothetical protein|uniref:hypothetical protein n=1 Tax=Caballeronia sp. TaxID=1931223 RepID=UPI00261E6B90|nr:hypothetical protein [Caballeronia sp.]MDB5833713.1 hypothetical protein [Caballeronia sp.]